MAFLDNSGNIILDAVLTDTGRARLAKGDGSFKIAKFALGDDEINYEQFNKNHPSGSAYYDIEILQTPVLESFTNNASLLHSKLLSIGRTNLLYLPILKINDINTGQSNFHAVGAYAVAVDSATETDFANINGVIPGETLNGGVTIRVDQGLDTNEIPPTFTIDSDLLETQYTIEMDSRFGKIVSPNGTAARVSYVDDDSIASYSLSLGTDPEFVGKNEVSTTSTGTQVVAGPRGTTIQFRIQSSLELNTSTYLFNQLGSTTTMNSTSVRYIDSTVRVMGATTGMEVDIPVRFIKSV